MGERTEAQRKAYSAAKDTAELKTVVVSFANSKATKVVVALAAVLGTSLLLPGRAGRLGWLSMVVRPWVVSQGRSVVQEQLNLLNAIFRVLTGPAAQSLGTQVLTRPQHVESAVLVLPQLANQGCPHPPVAAR